MFNFVSAILFLGLAASLVHGNDLSDSCSQFVGETSGPAAEFIRTFVENMSQMAKVFFENENVAGVMAEWMEMLPEILEQNQKVMELHYKSAEASLQLIRETAKDMDYEALLDNAEPLIAAVMPLAQQYNDLMEQLKQKE